MVSDSNKVMLMTAESGKEIVAKMPFSRIISIEYSTAFEVAILKYDRACHFFFYKTLLLLLMYLCPTVKPHSVVPVSNVIAWSSDASNPIGSEYTLMEKAGGRQLKYGGDLDQLQRFKLIKNLARLQGQLVSLEFPGYGNLYMRHSPLRL